jgi:hypothetical protein
MYYVCWFKYVRITDVVGASMNVVRDDDGITQSGGDEVRHVELAPGLDASVFRPKGGYTALRILPRRAARPSARKKKVEIFAQLIRNRQNNISPLTSQPFSKWERVAV